MNSVAIHIHLVMAERKMEREMKGVFPGAQPSKCFFISHIKERQVEYFFRTAEIVKYLELMFSSLVYFLSKAVLFSLRKS